MRAIKIDNNQNPVIVSGRFEWVYGIDVIKQNCDQAMRQQIGELNYDKDKGVQYFENVFTGNPNFQRFEAESRTQILNTPGVTGIQSFSYEFIESTLHYEAKISTEIADTIIKGQL